MKFSQNLSFRILLVALVSLATGCGSGDDNSSAPTPDFSGERELQLNTLYDQGIESLHQDFVAACEELSTSLIALCNEPTTPALSLAREHWQEAILIWKRCELYDVGRINNSFIHFRIQRWPIDQDGLAETLSTSEIINANFVSSRGSSIIGLSAIEYLLFYNSKDATLQNISTDSNYNAYLWELGQYLYTEAQSLQASWTSYAGEFTGAVEHGLDGGQNMMANALIAYLEETFKLRVGDPFGENNGGTIMEEDLEAPFAEVSLPLIKSGFEEWTAVYRGEFANSSASYGFDDYLVELGYDELDIQIEEAIQQCESALQALNGSSLREQLSSNPTAIENLQTKLRALLVLIKVDLSSNLSIVVTVNDTDGD